MYLDYCAYCANIKKQKSIGIVKWQRRSNSRCKFKLAAPSLQRVATLLFQFLFITFLILAIGYVGNNDFESAQEIEKHLQEIATSQSGGAE